MISPVFFMALGHYVLRLFLVTLLGEPEVRLGIGNECYHIKYENILKKFR